MPTQSDPSAALLSPESITVIRSKLRAWSRRHQRPMPWREESDPYKVWISEIMLQQTTVVAVVPFFERFVARFPTVERLASAAEEDVLKVWEGLGYYSRARNLHLAARQIVDDYAGRMPRTVESLQELPGIGRYTAGAIASFAHDLPAPILEANTLRLYARLAGFDGDPYSSAGQQLLWKVAGQLVPPRSPGRFNQALIDFGATVCRPADPNCPRCPLQMVCRAGLNGQVDRIPRQKSRPEVTNMVDVCIVSTVKGARSRYLLRQYSEDERWAGLWDFPRLTIAQSDPAQGRKPLQRFDALRSQDILDLFQRELDLRIDLHEQFHELQHTVTRYRIRLMCYRATIARREIDALNGEWRLATPEDLEELPLTATARRIARVIHAEGQRR